MTTAYSVDGAVPKMMAKLQGRIESGVRRHMPLYDSTVVQKKMTNGYDVNVNISNGGNSSTGLIVDGGTITHAGPNKVQKRVHSALLYYGLKIGRDAVHKTRSKAETINHLKDEVDLGFEQLGSDLDSMMIGRKVADVTGAIGTTVTTFTVSSFARVEPGRTYEVLDSSASYATLGTIVVTDVSYASAPGGNHTVTATGTLSAAGASGDILVHKGHVRTNEQTTFYSIQDACDSNVDMYGLTAGGEYEWLGDTVAAGGALTIPLMGTVEAKRFKRSKRKLRAVICDPFIEEEYIQLLDAQVNYPPGGSVDIRRYARTTYKNAPVIVDANAPQDTMFFLGERTMRLNCDRMFKIDGIDAKNPPRDLSAFRSHTTYDYLFEITGSYQEHWFARNGAATLTGITI